MMGATDTDAMTAQRSSAEARLRSSVPVFVIRPSRGWLDLKLGEVWEYRQLLSFLTWREIAIRYKQTAIGASWAVIQPLLTMVVFTLFFGKLAKISSQGVPYPIFSFAALLPWQFFSKALSDGGMSLVQAQRIITKVYFPRILLTMSAVIAGLLDFGIAFVILLAMMVYYRIQPSAAVLTLPLFMLVTVASALGAAFWLAALNVEYRDIRQALPFVVQLWLFATPVIYPATIVPSAWRGLLALNPMVGAITGFRWALLGTPPPDATMLWGSVVMSLALFVSGVVYFRVSERTFADRV